MTVLECDQIRDYIRALERICSQYVEDSEPYKKYTEKIETVQEMLDRLPAKLM